VARPVRFTAVERRTVGEALTLLEDHFGAVNRRAIASVRTKLEASELPVRRGLPVARAIEAFRGVLGGRLIEPPSSASGVFAAMQKRLTALGLTIDNCAEVARAAGGAWTGAIKAESIIRQADRLLSGNPGTELRAAPIRLDDDDI
jgi:hypothetical protein